MFYAHFVLAKKGPLAKIWLAAHWDKKLTKAHVFETNIEKSVDGILKPKVKMALRTSGHLLLGVVRIYSRKAKYLLADCNEAFVKIKMAFRPDTVDLPEEHREAAMNAITLPEVFHDFDTAMPELNEVDIEAQFSLNQSRAEEITMREDYGSLNLVTHDDGFGDMGFDTDNPDIMREAITEGPLEQSNLLFGDGSSLELGKSSVDVGGANVVSRQMEPAPHHSHMDDGFGGTIGDDFSHAGGLFEGDLFGEVSAGGASTSAQGIAAEQQQQPISDVMGDERAHSPQDDDMHYDDVPPSPTHSWDGDSQHDEMLADTLAMPPPAPPQQQQQQTPQQMDLDTIEQETPHHEAEAEQSTLLQNEEESFALAPVDTTALKGISKAKRKRKLIVDEVKNISGEEMKNQLSDTSDIVSALDLAPPTRRLMHWKETGGVEKLFTLPATPVHCRLLFKKYQRNMMLRSEYEEAAAAAQPAVQEEQRSPEQPRRSTRKRKHQQMEAEHHSELEPQVPTMPEYEPSVDPAVHGSRTPAYQPSIDEHHPGMEGSMTPGYGGMTPGGLAHGGLTPGGLAHGGMTPAGLAHGGMTPAGLAHGGMTPSGLAHGEMTPAGLAHGGITPAGLAHGGMTPAGLGHGGMTPAGLGHGGMTPAGLGHGGMTPAGLGHGGMTPLGLQHGDVGSTMLHGGMTPQHGIDDIMPHLHGDQVSSILGDNVSAPSADLEHSLPIEPLPMHGLSDQSHYQSGMQMANLGYDENHGNHSPARDDYDLPPSVENGGDREREEGETEEQFEERVLNRRATQLFTAIRPKLQQGKILTFSDIAPYHNNRKQAAQKFYSLLVLKKFQVLRLEQQESYGELCISKGLQFETEEL